MASGVLILSFALFVTLGFLVTENTGAILSYSGIDQTAERPPVIVKGEERPPVIVKREEERPPVIVKQEERPPVIVKRENVPASDRRPPKRPVIV